MFRSLMLLAIVASLTIPHTGPLSARPWKGQPSQVAFDYAVITDNRPAGEFVLVGWIAAPTALPQAPAATREFMAKHVLLLATWGKLDRLTNKASFQDIGSVEVKKASGETLTQIKRDALPPAEVAILASMEAFFKQLYGAFGPGLSILVFDQGDVDACTKGGLTARLANETYDWNTPFPGCVKP